MAFSLPDTGVSAGTRPCNNNLTCTLAHLLQAQRICMFLNRKRVSDFHRGRLLAPAALAFCCLWCGKMRFAHLSTP